jgi:hypothetical protein
MSDTEQEWKPKNRRPQSYVVSFPSINNLRASCRRDMISTVVKPSVTETTRQNHGTGILSCVGQRLHARQ